jgi:formate hydrogenlyase subunit 3/multisubunit Na+/H+ antiporter MnhD subunit
LIFDYIEELIIYFPLVFAISLSLVDLDISRFKRYSLIGSFTILAINVVSVLYYKPVFNEFFSYLLVSGQEKTFDLLIYRNDLTDFSLLSISLLLFLTNVRCLYEDSLNQRFNSISFFLAYWFSMLAILADSLILFFSSLEILGFILALLVIANGDKEKIYKTGFVQAWGVSSLLMMVSLIIFASVFGESKGIYDVTISSIPVLVNEIEYFPNKNIAIICILVSFMIRIGVFPFHKWLLSFLDVESLYLKSILSWMYPHVLFVSFIKLFVEVFQADIAVYVPKMGVWIMVSNLFIAMHIFRFKRYQEQRSLMLSVLLSMLFILSMSLEYGKYDYGLYFLLTISLFTTSFLFMKSKGRVEQTGSNSTKIYILGQKALVSMATFFPFSMFFCLNRTFTRLLFIIKSVL